QLLLLTSSSSHFPLFLCSVLLCHLHSFPTRRSSDLLITLRQGLFRLAAAAGLETPTQITAEHIMYKDNEGSVHSLKTMSELIPQDRKSTRLNSSHVSISYAVFCLKKKTKNHITNHKT